jgi:hypothetical protein
MKTIVFDIDGTLSDPSHRRHYVENKPKDFDSFYKEMGNDSPKEDVVELCQMYKKFGWYVVIFSGRPDAFKEITIDWLSKYHIEYDELHMRPSEKIYEPDDQIKERMLLGFGRKVSVSVDDRQKVVDMWRRNGVTCLQVDDGDF